MAKHSRRACDKCAALHKKCDGVDPCTTCRILGVQCTRRLPRQAGPKKGWLDKLKDKVVRLENENKQLRRDKKELETVCSQQQSLLDLRVGRDEDILGGTWWFDPYVDDFCIHESDGISSIML